MSEISEIEIKSMTKEQNYIRGYKNGKSDVLGKIRTEIELLRREEPDHSDLQFNDGLDEALQIIDEYIGGMYA